MWHLHSPQIAKPKTETMQYIVLFSHLTVQLPVQFKDAIANFDTTQKFLNSRELPRKKATIIHHLLSYPSSRMRRCAVRRRFSIWKLNKNYSKYSKLELQQWANFPLETEHLHDDTGHDVLERLLKLREAENASCTIEEMC